MAHETYNDLGIEIRNADYPDIPGMVDVHAHAFVETYIGDALTIPMSPIDKNYLSREALEYFVFRSGFLEGCIARRRDNIDNQSDTNRILVAQHKDRIVGFSHTSTEDDHGTLNVLYALPSFQRMRLGHALIKSFLNNSNMRQASLTVVEGTPAIRFYKRHGFEITESFPQEMCPQLAPGKWLPLLKMVRHTPNSV